MSSPTVVVKQAEKDFAISVTHEKGSWEVNHTYHDFNEFSKGITRQHPEIKLPTFPPNKNNVTEKLNEYLQAVVSNAVLFSSFEANFFLEIGLHITLLPTRPIILVPLPDREFDPSEVAVPWKLMTSCGFEVQFATEEGKVPQADVTLTREEGVVFGALGALPEPKKFYFEMDKCENFQHPIKWADIVPSNYHGLLLGGGHAPGMKQYLESTVLQEKIAQFWELHRPVAAICHGVLLLARSKNPTTGKSVLYEKKTTSLPKHLENMAYAATFWKYGKLYRTYEMHCETEIRTFLADPNQFVAGPWIPAHGTLYDDTNAVVVEDGNYVSGRFPGDAYLLGKKFVKKVEDYVKGL